MYRAHGSKWKRAPKETLEKGAIETIGRQEKKGKKRRERIKADVFLNFFFFSIIFHIQQNSFIFFLNRFQLINLPSIIYLSIIFTNAKWCN